jgi:hypothetical protein
MKVTITCDSLSSSEFIYDLLVSPVSGEGSLYGSKTCIDSHETIPDIMQFDLSNNEIKDLEKIPGVRVITEDDDTVKHDFTKIPQTNIPKIASFTSTFPSGSSVNQATSHSLYYCQTPDLYYTHQSYTSGVAASIPSIDCSNVDILVLDSGIDITHPDFFDNNSITRVVQFNWTQLREGDPINGTVIVSSQSVNYYNDTQGHGSACASLAAGKRCGFAKNAKIYSLRSNSLGSTSDGFTNDQCVRLALAFQKAKKLNLYGLSSTRPTVFTNSWGYTGPYVTNDLNVSDSNTSSLFDSVGYGKVQLTYTNGLKVYNALNGLNSTTDGYFRQIIAEGIHTLISAGNENFYLTNNPVSSVNVINFRRSDPGSVLNNYTILRTSSNNDSYSLNVTYNGYTAGSTTGSLYSTRYFYSSPNIGLNFSKSDYPIIVVGDISPVGDTDSIDSNIYSYGGNSKSFYFTISSISTEERILSTRYVRYKDIKGPYFIKTSYSNFGPDVDIYTPGNGAWAALSNQSSTSGPVNTISVTEKYKYFNGTSAACPIAAGILATYLADNPSATPAQSRSWMLHNAVSGNIMQIEGTSIPINTYNGTTQSVLGLPHGSNISNCQVNAGALMIAYSSSYPEYFKKCNIDDLLFLCRFFNSKNLVAQAFPLRAGIFKNSNDIINYNSSTLNKKESTSETITQNISAN